MPGQLKRREFIALLGGAAAGWPLAARAQQPAMPVIGLLSRRTAGSQRRYQTRAVPRIERRSGPVSLKARCLIIKSKWAEGHYDRLPGACL